MAQTTVSRGAKVDNRSFCDKSMKVGTKLPNGVVNVPGGGTTLADVRFPFKSRWIPRWPPKFRSTLNFDYSFIKQHALCSLMNKFMQINIFSSYLISMFTIGLIKQDGRQYGRQKQSDMSHAFP
jgi:hypothetical protein